MDTDEELLQVSADAFYRLNGKPSSNSDVRLWRFWRDVALRLGQLEYRRAMSARRANTGARCRRGGGRNMHVISLIMQKGVRKL